MLKNIELEKFYRMEEPPKTEPDRQYYFITKAKQLTKQLEEQLGKKPTYCVTTFGCQMNARDSEKLTGILELAGYEAAEEELADLVIYNTCTVRDNANQRVYGRLGNLNSIKKRNPHKRIALCGCMMQEPSVIEKIRKSYSFVDLILVPIIYTNSRSFWWKCLQGKACLLISGRIRIRLWKICR